jgi:hypothetical protein
MYAFGTVDGDVLTSDTCVVKHEELDEEEEAKADLLLQGALKQYPLLNGMFFQVA